MSAKISDNIFICKLLVTNVENAISTISIYSNWRAENVEVKIIEDSNDNQWTGISDVTDLQDSAKDLEIPYDQFLLECQTGLSGNGEMENFIYKLTSDNKFLMQKHGNFKITYLEITLSKTSENLKNLFIKQSIDIMNCMRAQLVIANKKCKQKSDEHTEIEVAYKRCIAERHSLEHNLLSKFIIILNAKKDKIVELESMLYEQDEIFRPAKRKVIDPTTRLNGSGNEKEATDDKLINNDDDFDAVTQTQSQVATYRPVIKQPQIVNLPKRKNLQKVASSEPSCSHNSFIQKKRSGTKPTATVTSASVSMETNDNDENPDNKAGTEELFEKM